MTETALTSAEIYRARPTLRLAGADVGTQAGTGLHREGAAAGPELHGRLRDCGAHFVDEQHLENQIRVL